MAFGAARRLRARTLALLDRHAAGRLLRVLGRELAADDVFGMAAEMAYRFLFAVFPLLLLLAAALGFAGDALGVDDLFGQLLRQVEPFLPADVTGVIDRYVAHLLGSRSPGFLTLGLLGTLWGAAGGVGTLIKGLNRAYDVAHPRPFWKRQFLALIVTETVPPTALGLLLLALLGQGALVWLGLSEPAASLLAVARWPLLVATLWLGLSLLYHVLPNTRHHGRWSLLGGAIGTLGWLALTQGFSLYVAHFGNYDATYGSFGAVIVFLLWLYLAGVVVLLGAEISALLEPKQRQLWLRPSSGEPDASAAHRQARPEATGSALDPCRVDRARQA